MHIIVLKALTSYNESVCCSFIISLQIMWLLSECVYVYSVRWNQWPMLGETLKHQMTIKDETNIDKIVS